MLSYIGNDGRLGECISYIYGLFKFCQNNDISSRKIVIDYNYKNKSLLRNKRNEYVFHDCQEMFSNVDYIFKDVDKGYFDNFEVIDIKCLTDITLLYNFYKYNDNFNKNSDIIFKNYWSLDDFFRLKDPYFDYGLLNRICRPKKLVTRLKKKYSDILTKNCIGIHIRREDYIGIENPDILIEDVQSHMIDFYRHKKLYTKQDIVQIIEDNKDKNILLFSDDIKWLEDNFEIYRNVNIIKDNKPFEDMILLSLCGSVIKNPGSFFSQISKILNESNGMLSYV